MLHFVVIMKQIFGVFYYRWTTKIHLPLRSENYQTKNLFHDVHPSLLLFLHRLRSITIFNEVKICSNLMHHKLFVYILIRAG